jgi:hypothetical protein
MVRVDMAKWGQGLEELRQASLQAPHRRTRERFKGSGKRIWRKSSRSG